MNNFKKPLLAAVLILILLALVWLFFPLGQQRLNNDADNNNLQDESSSELKLNETDASKILAFFLTSYEGKLPQGISIKDCEISFDNSRICISIKVQKDNLNLPVDLDLEVSPSTQNNIICLDVKEAQIAGILVFPSMAVEQLANIISAPSTIEFHKSQILIDLSEYPVKIKNISFDNESIVLQITL